MGKRSATHPAPRTLSRRALLASAAAATTAAASREIIVASKIDTEGALLGNLIAQILRAHGLAVRTRLQLGPTAILRQALLHGAIDIYPEYTGNGARFFHKEGDPAWHNAQAAWQLVHDLDAANGIVWLKPAPADNGWGIALRRDVASRMRATSLADFARFVNAGGSVRLAASVEFVESPDALPAFEHAYGFRLRQDQILALAGGDTSATIRAAAERISGITAAMAYSTDGALAALDMMLLTDPRHAQIEFQPAPVARAAVLGAYPDIATWLAPTFAALTTNVLRGLNARIAAGGEDPATVAASFLAGRA